MTLPDSAVAGGGLREQEIRDLLARRLQASASWDPSARIIPELSLCQSEARVDLAVVDRELTGWEIKAATDRLSRLPRQQETYGRVFDRMWLAADERHVARALEQLPQWWGILQITGTPMRPKVKMIRASKLNREIELSALVSLLWRDEALGELELLGLGAGLQRHPRPAIWAALASACPRYISKTALRARVRERLRCRTGWRVASRQT